MKNAPMAQKFCDQGRKTTFATLSANDGFMHRSIDASLLGQVRRIFASSWAGLQLRDYGAKLAS